MPSTTIKYFAHDHLPPKLQLVSKPLGDLASRLEAALPDGPEKSTGMRKLLEAKDCFVRVAVDMPDPGTGPLQPYQLRVLEEKQDLDMRIARLDEFAQRNQAFLVLPEAERERLNRQLDAQRALSAILGERIQAWEGVAQ